MKKWHFGEQEEEIDGELRGGECDDISDSQTCTSLTQLINPVYYVSEGDLWDIMRGVSVGENKKVIFIGTHTLK